MRNMSAMSKLLLCMLLAPRVFYWLISVRFRQVFVMDNFNECVRSLSEWFVAPHVALQAQVGNTTRIVCDGDMCKITFRRE